ncbi:MAG: GntR family transcriptional regulator [Lachnospiraceae bacterium]|nr:GntR family transcriptional regulator [Lachnospiraceae bacterium]
MNINISNTSGQPIYDQISKQIRAQIMSGELAEGELLPSMRMLAKELRISVITTKRAYEELERDGFIATVAGKGSFVAPKNLDFVREEHLRQIEEHMKEIVALARGCQISIEDLKEMLDYMAEEE